MNKDVEEQLGAVETSIEATVAGVETYLSEKILEVNEELERDLTPLVIYDPTNLLGKTVVDRLTRQYPMMLRKVVILTTRPLGLGEEDGLRYHFIQPAQLDDLERRGELLDITEDAGGHVNAISRQAVLSACDPDVIGVLNLNFESAENVTIIVCFLSETTFIFDA